MLQDLKTFYALIRPYQGKIWLSAIFGSIGGALTGAGLTNGVERLFTGIFSDDRALMLNEIILVASIFPVLFLIIGGSNFLGAYLLQSAGLSAIRDLRIRVFDRLQLLSFSYFQKNSTGDLIARITGDTQMLQITLNYVARKFITQPATIIGAAYFLTLKAVQDEGVLEIYLCLAALPIVIFPIRHITLKLSRKAVKQQEEFGGLTQNIAQNLSAAREVRAFNLEERESTRFRDRAAQLFKAQMKVVKYGFSLPPVIETISSVGLSIAFVIGYFQGVAGGVFTGVFLGLYFLYTAIKNLGMFAAELSKGAAALSRVEEILNEPIDVVDNSGAAPLKSVNGEIRFEHVDFSYDSNPALRSVNAQIPAGSTCALVGPSGSGKSTFVNLLPRFFDVANGSISIDGRDLRSVPLRELRQQIALVSQEPVLFDDTVMENIRLGRQDASNDEVMAAAEDAFADEFIRSMDKGYNEIVGERGARLSGGQRQRIAIARAFLRAAPILILDEATSALDTESEEKVQQALRKLIVGKTVIIIAHRFSTIDSAQQILVFENGQIVDSGSHDDLIVKSPLYRRLYNRQV
ncbi:ABC transporter ATP-binding protein [Candidatus Pelagisphaera phototrophica]|uniref:ABC transporter ATP-binding protein n=1 Tax=Candidatus Pelagisphaera phototrophica TaxID=2684113 RepID=UPI0019F8DE77|nr:ABC transporter ATP-binding protein [Candidatus Pelagisphaera phototrophica]QXD33200.1 ABC transporter ATP-binding protein/permease [Candidatus Pelagisphaera phototrophica]